MMDINLTTNDEVLKQKFFSLKTRRDISNLLQIKHHQFIYLLYRVNNRSKYYDTFEIKKKSGGIRTIKAPKGSLKIIQQKLSKILILVHQPKLFSHGFNIDRSVLTNAKQHIHKRYVLNIDLENFFDEINFGRIRGLFMAKPFEFNKTVATTLAQIMTMDNSIPQGAPTSPVLSNMVCSRLDTELGKLAKANKLSYTRYADDITFSSNQSFPQECMRVLPDQTIVCDQIEKIINRNGFKINKEKVRLQTRNMRQEVTGITVNEKPNVKRKYIKEIRAMLYGWKKVGLKKAEDAYNTKYKRKQTNPNFYKSNFENVLKGKLAYLKMIKGENNITYRKLNNRFYEESEHRERKYILTDKDIRSSIFVVDLKETNGTAFLLHEYGLVTCAHVVSGLNSVKVFNPINNKMYSAKVKFRDDRRDIALLEINISNCEHLRIGDSKQIERGLEIKLAGFPNFVDGDEATIYEGKIVNIRTISLVKCFTVDCPIIGGNSGGPILDKDNKVIGIAAWGVKKVSEKSNTDHFRAISIKELVDFLQEIKGV